MQVGEIMAFKLVNGDEVVGKVESFTDTEYILNRPCVVVGGAKSIGLMSAMFSLDVDTAVTVRVEHVMMQCQPVKQMRDHYISVTTGTQPVTGEVVI